MAGLIEKETDGAAKCANCSLSHSGANRNPGLSDDSISALRPVPAPDFDPGFTGVTKRRRSERLADQAFAWRGRSPFPYEVSFKNSESGIKNEKTHMII